MSSFSHAGHLPLVLAVCPLPSAAEKELRCRHVAMYPSTGLSSHICALCRLGLLQSSSMKGVGPNSVSGVIGSFDFISSVALLPGGGVFQRQHRVQGESHWRGARKDASASIPSVCGLVTVGSSFPWPHPSAAEPVHHRLKLFPLSCFPRAFVTAMEN